MPVTMKRFRVLSVACLLAVASCTPWASSTSGSPSPSDTTVNAPDKDQPAKKPEPGESDSAKPKAKPKESKSEPAKSAKKRETFIGRYSPEKGSTVGVAMPVSITFNKPIADKAAVERGLNVTSSPAVKGSWSWVEGRDGKDRIDYRPREYWPSGAEVTLRMSLDGVKSGDLYGTQNRTVQFTVGERVTSVVDVETKRMTVSRDGAVLRTVPVSAGKAEFETWNGTMVVLGKIPVMDYTSESVGITDPDESYDLKDVEWNVRLTPSGTYAHAAPWNTQIGKYNTSHGCINLKPADAKWFYDQVQLGDPVTVVNSRDTVAVSNGYGAWNVDWATWKQGSALK